MLTENDVIKTVCKYLQRKDYRIISVAHTTEKGHDNVASHPCGEMLYIEAKGETSTLKTSKRYGIPFSSKQITSHYARALLKTLITISPGKSAGIAVPHIQAYERLIHSTKHVLLAFNIKVYLVNQNGSVTVY